jgi:flagellar hook assembly protein FlgD
VTTFTDPFVPLNRTPYYYWVQTVGAYGASKPVISTTATAVEESAQSPRDFRLYQARPNPFNPSTTLSFTLPSPSPATLAVYDITGRKVRTLVSGPMSAGTHMFVWNGLDDAGRPVSSGVYLYRLTAGGMAETRRMTLVR